MEESTFTYRYSATRRQEVEAIRKKYTPQEEDKLERLRRLDGQVQGAGMVASLCLGIVGLLIFGLAMCFALGVFGPVWWPTIPFGSIGLAVMLRAYPLYRELLEKRKAELTPEILRLTEELMGE